MGRVGDYEGILTMTRMGRVGDYEGILTMTRMGRVGHYEGILTMARVERVVIMTDNLSYVRICWVCMPSGPTFEGLILTGQLDPGPTN